MARLEHANITVGDADHTAGWLGRAFGWSVMWQGPVSKGDGRTVFVGNGHEYLALFEPAHSDAGDRDQWKTRGRVNHIGIVVEDLGAAETAITGEGYTPHAHHDYEPGKRFYFFDDNDIEFEIVCYD